MSNEAKFTKGPWKWEYDADDDAGTFTVYMADAIKNRACYDTAHAITLYDGFWDSDAEDGEQFAEAEANVRLIAASPELYDTLVAAKAIMDGYDSDGWSDAIGKRIDKVLRKARGEKGGKS